jgi:hypothetical protein
MPDRPPKDLAGIVASLIFAATIVVLMIIGAVLFSPLSTAGRRAAAAPRIPVSRSTRRETSSRALTIALREGGHVRATVEGSRCDPAFVFVGAAGVLAVIGAALLITG